MIVQTMIQMALDGERLVQELLEHVFLRRLTQQDALGVVVDGSPSGSADHLHHVGHRVVVVRVILAGVVLCVHDHDLKLI
jgi:hypothetical protein